jgi:hypothetical protein
VSSSHFELKEDFRDHQIAMSYDLTRHKSKVGGDTFRQGIDEQASQAAEDSLSQFPKGEDEGSASASQETEASHETEPSSQTEWFHRIQSYEFITGYPKSLYVGPDGRVVRTLFSGKVDLDIFRGHTVDINPDLNPDYVDNAQTILNVPIEKYDIILVDPPYSVEDAEHYKSTMVKRNKVVQALGHRSTPRCSWGSLSRSGQENTF